MRMNHILIIRSTSDKLFTDYYHYKQDNKLIKNIRKQDEKVFPYKTVYYDGEDHRFETPFFLKAESSGHLCRILHNPDNILGHTIIEVFDLEGRRICLHRRIILTGDHENPETIEDAEKMVETVESLFNEYGCEKFQTYYPEGEEVMVMLIH